MFKILNGYKNIDRNICFSVKEERRTRGHGVTLLLAKKQCRLDIKKFSFSQRTLNEWNRLSADCIGASTVVLICLKIKSIYISDDGIHLDREVGLYISQRASLSTCHLELIL